MEKLHHCKMLVDPIGYVRCQLQETVSGITHSKIEACVNKIYLVCDAMDLHCNVNGSDVSWSRLWRTAPEESAAHAYFTLLNIKS